MVNISAGGVHPKSYINVSDTLEENHVPSVIGRWAVVGWVLYE